MKQKKQEDEEKHQTKYTQIRVKSIKFLEKEAIAVYFYDMTHHIENQNFEMIVEEKQSRSKSNRNYQLNMSQEFR